MPPDTIVTRTIINPGFLGWTNGILEFVVLLLALASLIVFIRLMMSVRRAVEKVSTSVDRFTAEARPLIDHGSALVADARQTLALVQENVNEFTEATTAVSDELFYAAETAARRVDEVSALIDVLRREFEGSAISAISAIRGLKTGAAVALSGLLAQKMGQARGAAGPSRQRADSSDWDGEEQRPRRRSRRSRRKPRRRSPD